MIPQQTLSPPEELLHAHDYYHHVLFNKTITIAPTVNLTLQESTLQKFKPNPKTILAVTHHNLSLAYPKLFTQIGEVVSKQWVEEFYRSGVAKTLVIHQLVDEFFDFLQKRKSLEFQNHPEWDQILAEENLIYQLLYAPETSLSSYATPDSQTSLLSCELVWKTPWRVHTHKLWFRNPQTLLVEAITTQTPQFWHCFATSSPTLEEAFETTLDQIEACDTNELLESVVSLLHELMRLGVADLKQASQS